MDGIENYPSLPGSAKVALHPTQHRSLVAESRRGIEASDVEYCGECWHVVDGDACPDCGSTERYDFADP